MSAKVTLKDVAKEAGVSYQTVSKVLQGQIKVTPETQARIETAVSQLGYRPNVAARNLRTQSSNLIGYAWRLAKGAATHPILDQFLASAAQVVEAHGYHLLTFLIGDDEPLNVTPYRELFARRQVEGFILADTNHNDPRIAYLIEQNIPFASFGRANDAWDYCWVDVDGQYGSRITVEHLLAKGHRRIGLLTWPEGSRAGEEREQGYRRGLQEAGIAGDEAWLIRGDNSVQSGFQGVNQLLELPEAQRPTAVMCVSDQIAIGALNGAQALGLEVGQDIAVTGFDDMPTAEFLHPALTTVRQPIPEVGQQVVNLLLKQLNDEPIDQTGILLKPELVIRHSS